MAQAQGKYFAFWDSDDYLSLTRLKILYKKCEQEQADLCLCGAYTFNDGSDKITIDETIIKRRFLPMERCFQLKRHPEYISTSRQGRRGNKLVKRGIHTQNGIEFQNLRNANDTYFSFMCMYYAKRITYVTTPLVYYRVNNSESITGKATTDPLCGYKAFAKIYNEMLTNGISDKALQSFYSRLYNGLVRTILILGEDGSMQTAYNKIRD
jgi:glycosyltransferase involved in cell wall biosynthesis